MATDITAEASADNAAEDFLKTAQVPVWRRNQILVANLESIASQLADLSVNYAVAAKMGKEGESNMQKYVAAARNMLRLQEAYKKQLEDKP